MSKPSRIIGTAGPKGCKYGCIYCFTRNPTYKRSQRLDILRPRDLINVSLCSQVVQPTCDTELLLIPEWKNYVDELVSTGKIISFATKSEIDGEDLRYLKEINEILMANGKVLHIGVTIVKLRDWKELEPSAPSPDDRIATLRRLWEAGIPTTLLVRPMLPMLTKEEIDELVERTYRFCHGYLSGPLYLTPTFEEYLRYKGILFDVTERTATWQEGKPKLRVVECNELEDYLRRIAESKGRKLFENNVEAAIFSNEVFNQNWTEDTQWSPNVRREPVGTFYIVDADTSEFLLIFHRKLGKWLPPGGHVEDKETTLQAAFREVKEEVGIEVHSVMIKGNLDKDGLYYKQVTEDPASPAFCTIEEFIRPIGAQDPHIHVDSIYVGMISSEEQAWKKSKEEVTAMDFFSVEQIKQLETFDNVPTVCRAILQTMEKQRNLWRKHIS